MDQQTLTALTALIVAIGTLITSMVSLIKIFQHDQQLTNTSEKVNQIEKNTNGVISSMQTALQVGTRAPGSRRATDPPVPGALPAELPSA